MAALMCMGDDAEGEGSTEEDQDDGDEEEATPKEEQADVEAIVSAAVAAAEERGEKLQWLELDELDISDDDLRRLDLPTKCPDLVGLSLRGNPLESVEAVMDAVAGLSSLRALWLNQTPIALNKDDELREAFGRMLPHLEIYNSKLTDIYSLWAVGFCVGVFGAAQRNQACPLQKSTCSRTSRRLICQSGSCRLSPHMFSTWRSYRI